MKTKLLLQSIMMISVSSLLIISCSKESNSLTSTPEVPGSTTIVSSLGSIVDAGPVNTDTRVMNMAFVPKNYTLYSDDESVSNVTAQIQVAFYVNSDGLIPTGEYSFSNGDSKTPFTFDSGQFHLLPGSDATAAQNDQIVDGKIIVTHDINNYVFAVQVNLASGLNTSQSYNGTMAYSDSY